MIAVDLLDDKTGDHIDTIEYADTPVAGQYIECPVDDDESEEFKNVFCKVKTSILRANSSPLVFVDRTDTVECDI